VHPVDPERKFSHFWPPLVPPLIFDDTPALTMRSPQNALRAITIVAESPLQSVTKQRT